MLQLRLEADNCAPCCLSSLLPIFNHPPRDHKDFFSSLLTNCLRRNQASRAPKIVHLNKTWKGPDSLLPSFSFPGRTPPPPQQHCSRDPFEESISSPGLSGLGLQQRVGVRLCLEVCILLIAHPQSLKRQQNVAAAPLRLSRRKENRFV